MASAKDTNAVSFDIPKTYKAVIYDKPGTISTKIVELDTPTPGPGEVLIRLTHSGVCHSDLGLMECTWRSYPPTPAGQIGGHEGVGIVHALGPDPAGRSPVQVGDRVGIKFIASVCGSCDSCLEGREPGCSNAKYSGFYTPGTFQQYVLSAADYVTPIPEGVDSAEAAPMLCAGLTVYTALRKSNTKSGQWVVIQGAGGGLGHIACQLGSRGMALRVIGIDHGSKEKLVKDSGAEAFIDMTKFDDAGIAEEVKRIAGGRGAHAVIACTASNRAYGQALGMLRTGGTLVCVGMPEHDPVLIAGCDPAAMVRGQKTICAAAVGTRQEAKEVMEFVARGVVHSHYRLEKMERLTDVFKEMSQMRLNGRVVLDLE